MDPLWFCLHFTSLSMYLDSTASCDNMLQDTSLAEEVILSFVFDVCYSTILLGAVFNL